MPVGDWLPDVDGRFLGSLGPPLRRWDGSRLMFTGALKLEQLTGDALLVGSPTQIGRSMKLYGDDAGGISTLFDPRPDYGIIVTNNSLDPTLFDAQCVELYATPYGAYVYQQSPDTLASVDFSTVNGRAGFDAGAPGVRALLWAQLGAGLDLTGELYVRPGTVSTLPEPSEENNYLEFYRGKMIRIPGDSGVADKLYICMKKADDTYEWVQIA